jgi:hypothetical protein
LDFIKIEDDAQKELAGSNGTPIINEATIEKEELAKE